MKKPKIVFITGANRGIGLEFARQISENGDIVVAGYRSLERSKKLIEMSNGSERFFTFQIDVTDSFDVKKAYDFIMSKFDRLDMLINNAGINLKYGIPIDEVEPEDILENFRVNVIGPFLTTKALRPLLAKGDNPKIINISSQMGSIEMASANSVPYRISKAAVNMLSKNQALSYSDDGIITVAMHPGWVRTDMGGDQAPLGPDESAEKMLAVIDRITDKDNGAFLGFDGNTRPW